MSNDLNIKGSLNINNTLSITGITNDYLSIDDNSLFTGNASKDYTDDKYYWGTDTQLLVNSGGTISGTTGLLFDGTDLYVTGNTKTSGCLISIDGAMCIKMINKTGSPTLKGRLVTYNTSFDNSFDYYPFGNTATDPYIGIIFESGVADGEFTYIAVYGICDVYIASNSRKIFINSPLSSYDSTTNGDVLNSGLSEWIIGHSLEESEFNNIVKCLLYYGDTQYTSGGY